MNNARMGAHVRYFDIQHADMNGKKMWVAWFYENLESQKLKEFESSQAR